MLTSDPSGFWSTEVHIPSSYTAGKPVIDRLLDELQRANWPETDVFGVHLAVEEALINAIRHGNRMDNSKRVRIAYRLLPDRLSIEIVDEGAGFDPDCVPDPTRPENRQCPSGRGVLLMRNFMSRVEFSDRGKRVVMEKVRGNGA